jgi:hypothetical protein
MGSTAYYSPVHSCDCAYLKEWSDNDAVILLY